MFETTRYRRDQTAWLQLTSEIQLVVLVSFIALLYNRLFLLLLETFCHASSVFCTGYKLEEKPDDASAITSDSQIEISEIECRADCRKLREGTLPKSVLAHTIHVHGPQIWIKNVISDSGS